MPKNATLKNPLQPATTAVATRGSINGRNVYMAPGARKVGSAISRLQCFEGTPAEMLAAALAAAPDSSSVILRAQIVDAQKFKRELIQGATKLRQLKQTIQTHVRDLEAYKSYAKENGTKDSNGNYVIDAAHCKDFLQTHKDIAARLDIDPDKAAEQDCETMVDELLRPRTYELKGGKIVENSGPTLSNKGDLDRIGGMIDAHNEDMGLVDTQLSVINLQLQDAIHRCQALVTTSTNISAANNKAANAVIGNFRD